ncbi:MAG: phosphopantetheine-binding protein [Peptococcaceae bacterium]|nr:phosphopantetheine-binding protein [Peptococcaceae bacterium]
MINVCDLLYEICEDQLVYDKDADLVESGLLDSLGMIELFEALADEGIELSPTRVDPALLRTARGIEQLVAGAEQ